MQRDRHRHDPRRDGDVTNCPLCRASCAEMAGNDPMKLSICRNIFERFSNGDLTDESFDAAMKEAFGPDWKFRSVGAVIHDRMGPLELADTVRKT